MIVPSAQDAGRATPGGARRWPPGTLVGLGLVYGAGAGTVIGIAVGGGTGLALGAAVGAGLGVVAGAVGDLWSRHDARTATTLDP
ncbi:hypothetical protein [Ornithinimicrobium avium]|nr:hypothetical protein [Ornithinimicrobium avium]